MNRRLTRNEAIVALYEAVKSQPLPFEYTGGWTQILADAVCLGAATLNNTVIYRTRRDSPLFTNPKQKNDSKKQETE